METKDSAGNVLNDGDAIIVDKTMKIVRKFYSKAA